MLIPNSPFMFVVRVLYLYWLLTLIMDIMKGPKTSSYFPSDFCIPCIASASEKSNYGSFQNVCVLLSSIFIM